MSSNRSELIIELQNPGLDIDLCGQYAGGSCAPVTTRNQAGTYSESTTSGGELILP